METNNALEALSALAHDTRLTVFRSLVTAGSEGLPAGEIAARLGVLPNTLSAHLAQLSRGGLVKATREGRSIRYRADYGGIEALIGFLIRDCCGERPEVCAPLAALAQECAACAADNAPA
ncbi:helix-turn-helix transcriptional regulator [Afifella sp. IM 167]|uniref:ArsR/SmtB family transcription factor n=1 Tax=Afifella sp. IM 167 TaxID=2033586 RepID=UPI001CCD7A1C|nr:metalloregulator ArsR/SmtB family transcription factor [Afifella sp. IM 167]MBZ8133193.1 transcriptional regulator [Afifella sp. IM 167]